MDDLKDHYALLWLNGTSYLGKCEIKPTFLSSIIERVA